MKNRLTTIFPAVLLSLCLASCKSQEGQETPVSDITADPQSVSYRIDPAFFGVCDMFWKESDEYMEDGVIENYLKEMQCGFLRFPGGTESDNFDWRTNTLVDKRRWPNEDGQDKLTTDKFISLCRRIGAQPIICVNTEIAIFESEQTAIDLAADWVRYCNVEKGYGVKYWEIGNEPYYHYRFTAESYAGLFRKMAAAMKTVDPSIKVAAVGEWNTEWVGHLDRIPANNRTKAAEMEYSIDINEGKYVEADLKAMQTVADPPKWWETVLETAGDCMDAASIHWYYNEDELTGMTNALNDLTGLFSTAVPDKEIELLMTEWAMYHTIQKFGMERALTVGEAIGRSLDGNVRKSTYWPLRCGGDHDKKGLFMEEQKVPRANYHVYKMFSTHIGDSRIRCSGINTGTYNFATVSDDGKTVQIFVLNRASRTVNATLGLKGVSSASVTGYLLDSKGDKSTDTPEYSTSELEYKDGITSISVPPYSMGVYVFRQ